MSERTQVINIVLGDPKQPFAFDIETLHAKLFHEMLSEKGFISRPLINMFKEGQRVASMLAREPQNVDDKLSMFKEVFSLIATLKADVVFFGCDSWYTDFTGTEKPMIDRQHGIFKCVGMSRGGDAYHERSAPYARDHNGTIYYMLSAAFQTDETVADGQVLDLLKAVFEVSESPYQTAAEHAEALKDFGHALALWSNGQVSQVSSYGFEGVGKVARRY